MFLVHCNICKGEVQQECAPVNSCDRCAPFMEQYLDEYQKELREATKSLNGRMESFRQKFIQRVIVPATKAVSK